MVVYSECRLNCCGLYVEMEGRGGMMNYRTTQLNNLQALKVHEKLTISDLSASNPPTAQQQAARVCCFPCSLLTAPKIYC